MSDLGAVLWDMDGTLVDTEPYWIGAEHDIVREHGGHWDDELAKQLVGNDLLVSARFIIENSTVSWTPERVVEELVRRVTAQLERHVPWRPGARELLHSLTADGIPTALVTMSYSPLIPPVMAALGVDAFDVVITGDRVQRGKPHPESYLTAATELGVEPARCVALEDSPTGVRSALAAGMTTIGIPHVVPLDGIEDVILVPSLTELDLAQLRSVVSDRRLA